MTDPVPMELVGVRLELPTKTPILLLRETGGARYLPIWIGPNEATAIAMALEGVEPERPLTHDLLKLLAEGLGAAVDRVVVTELSNGTFFADLVMTQGGEVVTVSARPSDAIALAARTSAPVFASREVLDEAGVEIQESADEEEIERFREFLDEVSPDDFGISQG
jgi:bifunctional DNase/RNase